jgi:hypothetical protein
MRLRLIAANLAAAIVTVLPAHSAGAMQAEALDDFFSSVRPDADRY